MVQLIEVAADGTVHLPRELFGDTSLPAHYIVEAHGDVLTLRKVDETVNPEMSDADAAAWQARTPAERAAAIRAWAASHTEGPGLPDEALRRENMYD
jgi:hypothetical protein